MAQKSRLFYAIVMVGSALAPGSALVACSSSSDGGSSSTREGDSAPSATNTDASTFDAAAFDATDAWPTTK